MKISILLRNNYICLSFQSRYLPIGEKQLETKFWDSKKRRIKPIHFDHAGINKKIIDAELWANNYVRENKAVDFGKLKAAFDLYLKPDNKTGIADFLSYFDAYTKLERLYKGKPLSTHTVKSIETCRRCVRLYAKEKRYKYISFEEINPKFYDSFVIWCMAKGWQPNTIGARIKTIKAVMRSALKKGYHNNMQFLDFDKPAQKTDKIYLSIEELRKIKEMPMDKPHLLRTRDVFLIGCFTGLRFSELNILTKENIETRYNEDGAYKIMRVQPTKTAQAVEQPLHPIVIDILNEYNGVMPKPPVNQKMNEYLKEICRVAGITQVVSKTVIKNGTRQDLKIGKFDLVTTHTARRSFFTNAYLMGMDVYTLMTLSGKKTEKEFFTYICIEAEKLSGQVLNSRFYKVGIEGLKIV